MRISLYSIRFQAERRMSERSTDNERRMNLMISGVSRPAWSGFISRFKCHVPSAEYQGVTASVGDVLNAREG